MESEKVHGTGNFVPGSVCIVDYNAAHNNLLVRGSSAFGAGNFTMAAFTKAIKGDKNYSSTGITLADNPMIVDFCLIGYGPPNHKDHRIVKAEAEWFNSTNPPALNGCSGPYPTCFSSTTGTNAMVYWPILSIGGTPPTTAGGSWSLAAAVDQSITSGSDSTGYDYAELVPAISSALNNQPSKVPNFPSSITQIRDAVIYVHCDSGVNRTGAAVIGYLMQYGSNISALGIAPPSAGSCNTLNAAQTAARVNPPSNDVPPGGTDQAVPEAYCNLLNTKSATSPLASQCVPLAGTIGA